MWQERFSEVLEADCLLKLRTTERKMMEITTERKPSSGKGISFLSCLEKKNSREHFQLKYKVFLPWGIIIVVKCHRVETFFIAFCSWSFPGLHMQ